MTDDPEGDRVREITIQLIGLIVLILQESPKARQLSRNCAPSAVLLGMAGMKSSMTRAERITPPRKIGRIVL